jgi:hypothetical protein
LPEHRTVVGLHGSHAPATQNGKAPPQAVAVPQWPVASHVCTPLLEHWVAPGAQTPPHALPVHTKGHATGLPHVPPAHVSRPLPEHWKVPFAHETAHAPAVQTGMAPEQAAPAVVHCPVMSQLCGCWPLHWTAFGVQTPVHVPPMHAYGHDAPVPCQLPSWQVCGSWPMHSVAPGPQTPTHAPETHV